MDHYFDERYAAALEAFRDEQVTRSTALGDYILVLQSKIQSHAGAEQGGAGRFSAPGKPLPRFAPDPGSPGRDRARFCLAMKDARAALAVLANPKIGTSSETLYYQAKALDMAGEKEKAVELYLQIYSRYPTSTYSQAAAVFCIVIAGALSKGRATMKPACSGRKA